MKKVNTITLTSIAIMSAVLCVLGPMSISLPFSPVPISFATIGIFLSLYVLGAKFGSLSVIIYLILGVIGLPVFSTFSGGIGKVAGPTGGYLIGYVFLAVISGIFIDKFKNNKLLQFIGMISGTLICYLIGTIWLSFQADINFVSALTIGVLPYIVFDLTKIVFSILFGNKIRDIINNKLKA